MALAVTADSTVDPKEKWVNPGRMPVTACGDGRGKGSEAQDGAHCLALRDFVNLGRRA